MATIEAALRLFDGMSGPLARINKAMNIVIDSFEALHKESLKPIAIAGFEEAREHIAMAGVELEQIREKLNEVSGSQQDFNASIQKSASGANVLGGMFSKVAGAVKASFGTRNILELSDSFLQMRTQLGLAAGGMDKVDELQNRIYQSAQRSRTAYDATTQVVAKLGMGMGSVFSSSEETIAFAEQLNKQFALAGTSQQDAASASLRLAQAIGSGTLQGEELNEAFQAAPGVIQAIAGYMGEPVEKVRQLASGGEISAGILKNALFAAEDTDARFAQLPQTIGQLWTQVTNALQKGLEPVLLQISQVANSHAFQQFVGNALSSLSTLSNAAAILFDALIKGGNAIADHWDTIGPIFYGVGGAMLFYAGATAIAETATKLFNKALLSNPLFWIGLAVGAVIALLSLWVQKVGGIEAAWLTCVDNVLTFSETLMIGFTRAWYFILDALDKAKLHFAQASMTMKNIIGDLRVTILATLQNMTNNAIDLINEFIQKLNTIPGVSIDTIAHVTFATEAAAQNEADKLRRQQDLTDQQNQIYSNMINRQVSWGQMQMDAQASQLLRQNAILQAKATKPSAYNDYGQEIDYNSYNSLLDSSLPDTSSQTAVNTGDIKNSLDITNEELKYMRDAAEQEAINRYTLADISVSMTNQNTISSELDLDGIVNHMFERVSEEAEMVAAGAHR